jgi:hypothetical protein
MKTKEEIDELYHKCWDDFSSKYDDNLHYYSFVEAYTQCQEDMADKSKQETLEEAALNIIPDRSTAGWIDSFGATERIGFIKGAKWQQDNTDKKYTEEDIREAIDMARMLSHVSCLEEGEHRIKYSNTEDDIINSLNKQDI